MPPRLPQIKPRELIRVLERLGFVVRRQTGGHLILRHLSTKHIVSVPMHSGDIKRGLLLGILKQAEIPKEKFLRELKLE